jgi:hypothetical protein
MNLFAFHFHRILLFIASSFKPNKGSDCKNGTMRLQNTELLLKIYSATFSKTGRFVEANFDCRSQHFN